MGLKRFLKWLLASCLEFAPRMGLKSTLENSLLVHNLFAPRMGLKRRNKIRK